MQVYHGLAILLFTLIKHPFDLASQRRLQTSHNLHQGRLTGTISPMQMHRLTTMQGGTGYSKQRLRSKALANVSKN